MKISSVMRRFFKRAIEAWNAGGLLLRFLAVYAFLSPFIVTLFGGLTRSLWVVTALMAVGHTNTLVLIPFILWWRSFGGRAWWRTFNLRARLGLSP